MKIQILLTADYATFDHATGKIHILGAFNRIFAKKFPVIHPRMVVVVRFVASEQTETTDSRNILILLSDEDGNNLFQISSIVQLPIDDKGYRRDANIVLELNEFEFPQVGAYEFIIMEDDNRLGETTIEVLQS